MRLFVAIPFSPDVRASLAKMCEALRTASGAGNFTRPENLHMTLAFIGETDNVRAAARALAAVDMPAFSMTLGGLGRFGEVWWTGARENPALTALAREIRGNLLQAGFSIDRKPFRAHVTLARQLPPLRMPPLVFAPVEAPVRRIVLMKSERSGGRLVYSELFSRALRPSGD